jgi:uncharacterized membrane protein YgdD (TMEM256/DUF423 family)
MRGDGFFRAGAISAFVAVLAGAFAAHALRARPEPGALAVFETGARYQMYHAFALFAASWAVRRCPPSRAAHCAGWLFLAGTVLFSGSLYLLALTGARWLGAITPIGGVAFLLGWLSLAAASWPSAEDSAGDQPRAGDGIVGGGSRASA